MGPTHRLRRQLSPPTPLRSPEPPAGALTVLLKRFLESPTGRAAQEGPTNKREQPRRASQLPGSQCSLSTCIILDPVHGLLGGFPGNLSDGGLLAQDRADLHELLAGANSPRQQRPLSTSE